MHRDGPQFVQEGWQTPVCPLRSVTMARGTKAEVPLESGARVGSLFRNRNFLIPYLAEAQSIGGDQIGRVALSILVFDRTNSAVWTAFTYALTFLPAILGGFLLGGVGDRFPYSAVMVVTDLVRAGLFLCMAIPGVPLLVVALLVAAAFFLGPAFSAALVSRLAATLTPVEFRSASGIRMVTAQLTQVVGFAVGGVIVALVHPHVALSIDAATFVVSAVLIAAFVHWRLRRPELPATTTAMGTLPPTSPPTSTPTSSADPSFDDADAGEPPRLWHDPRLRHLILLTALAGFFVVPEGLAVPVAHDLGAPTEAAGLLLAAGPLGGALGATLLVRLGARGHGVRRAERMALACGLPLVAVVFLPPWPVVAVLFAVSGALWAYQVEVVTAFVHAVDGRFRSTAVARASALLLGAQGLGLVLFGAIGDVLGTGWGVGAAGAAGTLAAGAVITSKPDTPRHRATRVTQRTQTF